MKRDLSDRCDAKPILVSRSPNYTVARLEFWNWWNALRFFRNTTEVNHSTIHQGSNCNTFALHAVPTIEVCGPGRIPHQETVALVDGFSIAFIDRYCLSP
jgi:hypothetical protein